MLIQEQIKDEYKKIGQAHRKSLLIISARCVLGSSVIRVFNGDSKSKLMNVLESINVDELLKLQSQSDYKSWFEGCLSELAHVIQETNPNNQTIYPGYKWGHATKILNLYIREVVEYKRYFSESEAEKIRNWLYVPIDSLVMKKIQQLGHRLPFSKIKEIDSDQKYYEIQDVLGQAASAVGVPRIWFDDVWADRELRV